MRPLNLNIRLRSCTPMYHWLRDITLSSNVSQCCNRDIYLPRNICHDFQKGSFMEHAWEGGKRVNELKNFNATLWDAMIKRTD